jgi:hypothetical protein
VKTKEYDFSEVVSKHEKELDNMRLQLVEARKGNAEILTKLNEKPQKPKHRKKINHTVIYNEVEVKVEEKQLIKEIKPIEVKSMEQKKVTLSINKEAIKPIEIVKEKVDKSIGTNDYIKTPKHDKEETKSKEEPIPIHKVEESVSKKVQPKKKSVVILSKMSPITASIIANKEVNNKVKDVGLKKVKDSRVESSPEESIVTSKRSQSGPLESDIGKMIESIRVELKERLDSMQSHTNE